MTELNTNENIDLSTLNIHSCYMLLAHEKNISNEFRTKILENLISRNVIYYLDKALTCPHVCNPAWIPTEEDRVLIRSKLKELRLNSKWYCGKVIGSNYSENSDERGYIVNISEIDNELSYPSSWTPSGGVFTGGLVYVRVKEKEIIESKVLESMKW